VEKRISIPQWLFRGGSIVGEVAFGTDVSAPRALNRDLAESVWASAAGQSRLLTTRGRMKRFGVIEKLLIGIDQGTITLLRKHQL
jgi:hypothetical protein